MESATLWRGTDYNSYVPPGKEELQEPGVVASILVVDDNARMLRSVQDLLSAYGYDCITAEGGQAALNILAEKKADLLLLDLEMPGIDGFQVLNEVKAHYSSTDVIIVSGETSFDSATRVLRNGAQDFLRKPYVPDELIRAVENVAEKRKLEDEMRQMHRMLLGSEQRHRFIVNNSPDIIYMLDEQGRFSFVNERVQTLLGYGPEELIGRHFSELVLGEDLSKAKYAFAERRTGSRASHNVEFRLVPNGGDGEPRYFESRSVTIELNSMGVYAEEPAKGGQELVGTYGVARDISERKRAEEVINFQLYHDLLTKLPNRELFRDRLELAIAQAKRHKTKLAVMYLDMDRFKVINDSLGHLVGDQLLQAVATRLRSCLRDTDTLSRVGGDEFNLLLPEISCEDDGAVIAEKIPEVFKKPVILEGIEVFVSFSIGIAMYPKDGKTIDTLIKHADTAMYHVKGRGKKGFQFYSDEMKTLHSRHLSMESELRRALEEDQLKVFFQPQVNIATGKIHGVEALLRWQHPTEGLIPPDEFIPLAEENGLINDIGKWMLDHACETIRCWSDRAGEELVLAVNVSARQLMQADFQDQVLEAMERNRLLDHQLELEITENVLMQDMEQTVTKLKMLAQHGVRIAVDDFGTGYSSLNYLQTLPLHTLKIDRSFISKIQSPRDQSSIVTAIVSMARGLGLALVAEGVETQVQLEYLRGLGCSTAQGFFFEPPAPADEVMERYFPQRTPAA